MLSLYAGINYLILGDTQLCVGRAICGFPCPGCGLTHAGIYLLSGKFADSFRWHPFLIPVVLTLAITSVPYGWWKFADEFKNKQKFFIFLIAASSVYYIYRLITLYPQAPTEGPMHYSPHNYFEVIKNFLMSVFA